MIVLLTIAIVVGAVSAFDAIALKYGAEDRPGFNERRPLA
jgi:hypothetical protein